MDYHGAKGTARLYDSVRWVAWFIWGAVGFDELFKLILHHVSLLSAPALFWLGGYFLFAAALWLSSALAHRGPRSYWHSVFALVVAELCTFAILYVRPDSDADSFVFVLAWQAALVLPRAWVALWILMQTSALILVLRYAMTGGTFLWGLAAIYGAVQTFAFITADVAKREARSSDELARMNTELRATQLMLTQASQVGERVRIARELHDVLGHDLTALGLHLEVALNSADGAPHELRNARAIATGLMSKVREAVSLLRDNDGMRLTPILRSLAAEGPNLRVHLSITGDIDTADAARAHALVRCLQEIVTNARRHSRANNLWLDVRRNGTDIIAKARDDGIGTDTLALERSLGRPATGQGLLGMRERLVQFGGKLNVETASGKGFVIEVILPLGTGI